MSLKYKLIVSDLDGTMFGEDTKVAPENLAAIEEARSAGCVFAIASGRACSSVLRVAEKLGIVGDNKFSQYAICFNGVSIVETKTGEVIYDVPFANDYGKHVIKTAESDDVTIIAYINGRAHGHFLDTRGAEYERLSGDIMKLERGFEDSHAGSYNKILLRGEPHHLKEVEDKLAKWAKDRVSVVYTAPTLLEYFDKNASKGTAVLALAEKLGIKREEIIAMGDYYNDISMIKAAGLGVAIKNSPEEVVRHAGYVTERSAKDGAVAEVIRKFILSEV